MFNWIREYFAKRRRGKQEIFVGSAVFHVNWKETQEKTDIICSYYVDGDGVRYSRTTSEDTIYGRYAIKTHGGLIESQHNWEKFGELPSFVRRAEDKPKAKLYTIDGGKNVS